MGLFSQGCTVWLKGNGLGIYLRMSGVVALGSLLVQVTHTESGPVSEVGRTGGGISLMNGQGIGEPGVYVGPSSMYDTRQLGLASCKYYGRHLLKIKSRYLRGGSSDSDLLHVLF